MLHTVRYAAERGLHSYEFLGSADPWTAHWTQQQRQCVALRAYPWSVRGAASLLSDALQLAAKRVRTHWRNRAEEAAR